MPAVAFLRIAQDVRDQRRREPPEPVGAKADRGQRDRLVLGIEELEDGPDQPDHRDRLEAAIELAASSARPAAAAGTCTRP